MLSIEEFIVTVFCYIDDYLEDVSRVKKIRGRGFEPSLSDSEVITMEIVAEFLGIDTDKGIWEYFKRHWLHLFPGTKSRTTFLRQAANLWYWKQKLLKKFAKSLGAYDDNVHLVDGCQCRFVILNGHFFPKFSMDMRHMDIVPPKMRNIMASRGI
jgi:hypothetical protein